MVYELRIKSGCPEVSAYIYYSEDDLTAEEIVDKALAYKPIQL